MSFEFLQEPDAILEQILGELDEREIRRLVDDPLDAALVEYVQQVDVPVSPTQEDVLVVASGLVMHLYRQALPLRRHFAASQARMEAASLLERSYVGPGGNGFAAALLDACNGGAEVVQLVLLTLAGAVKDIERRKALWVSLYGRLSLLSLTCRYQLAKHVWEEWAPYHEKIARLTPGEIIVRLPELIAEFAESDNYLRRRFAS